MKADDRPGADRPDRPGARRASAVRERQAPRASSTPGPFVGEAPDLIVNFAARLSRLVGHVAGRRAGRATSRTTRKKWGGDHIIDPALVPGVLLMNRPFRGDGARLVDLAPTILAALGVAAGPAMEGSSLLP